MDKMKMCKEIINEIDSGETSITLKKQGEKLSVNCHGTPLGVCMTILGFIEQTPEINFDMLVAINSMIHEVMQEVDMLDVKGDLS